MKNNKTIRYIVLTALFAAMTTLMTMVHVPVGGNGGYIHVGDAMIYIAACFLPAPYAILAGAIGGGMADLISAPIYVIPTVIIKSLITVPFTSKDEKRIINKRNIVAVFISGVVTIVGYYIADSVLFGSWKAALATLIPNLIQAAGSGIVYMVFAAALDKANIKVRFKKICEGV